MKTINRVELIAHVGSIEFRQFETGKEICNLSVATKNSYKKADGEWAEDTEWHRCVFAIPNLIERMRNVAKGDYVRIEGAIRTKTWKNKDGVEQVSREITCFQFDTLSKAGNKEEVSAPAPAKATRPSAAQVLDQDEDLPF